MKKPNIVFLFADQLRFDALGCNGNELIETPNIDSIASDGMNFNHCFSPVSLCSPARACVFTGLHSHNHGQLANIGNFNNVFDRNVIDKENIFKALKSIEYSRESMGIREKYLFPMTDESEHSFRSNSF
jgi:choline-sulfatase